jgi:CheY-like chemotaxis protein
VGKNDSSPLTLLLVEDSPADVYLVKEALHGEGLCCHLQVADDGERAMKIIDQVDADSDASGPDVLLLDLNVPRRSGDEVLARFRRSPKCANIPVVIMTSSESPADRARVMELGATEYFRKPSNLAEFMKLGSLLRRVHEHARGITG